MRLIRLISKLNEHHYISNVEEVKEAILMREAESTTAIGMNVAIPHAKSSAVNQPAVAVMQNRKGIQWKVLMVHYHNWSSLSLCQMTVMIRT